MPVPLTTLATAARRERVLGWPLAALLLLVAAVFLFGQICQLVPADPEQVIERLADGDLDNRERLAHLRRLVEQAVDGAEVRHRWAGLLAAVAIGDRAALQRLSASLGLQAGAPVLPPPPARRYLDLGDKLLASVLAAHAAEADGDRAAAAAVWRQVAAQARLTGNSLAAEMAAAELARLR